MCIGWVAASVPTTASPCAIRVGRAIDVMAGAAAFAAAPAVKPSATTSAFKRK
jgi:hypothetical protein